MTQKKCGESVAYFLANAAKDATSTIFHVAGMLDMESFRTDENGLKAVVEKLEQMQIGLDIAKAAITKAQANLKPNNQPEFKFPER